MNRSRLWILLGGIAAGVAVLIFAPGLLRPKRKFEQVQIPPPQKSEFANADKSVGYVGSQICRECHVDQHSSYLTTMHSRSLAEVDPAAEPPDATIEIEATGRIYSSYRKSGKVHHKESIRTADGEEIELADHELRYVVGSGSLARTYLVESAGFYVESPMTWYAGRKTWDLSPGYEHQDSGFARPVYFECLHCHAGDVQSDPKTEAFFTIKENAIGCERCHGPGELHVQSRRSAAENMPGGIDRTIVNPAHLDRERSIAVCSQCHLNGKASVDISGRSINEFRPGMLWSDFRIDYTLGSTEESMEVVGHDEQMRASRCFQKSGSMTCITCHAPHSNVAVAERPLEYRRVCLSCHDSTSCKLAEPDRLLQTSQDLCQQCHMPRSPSDVVHVAATHHRVGVHSNRSTEKSTLESVELSPVIDISHFPRVEQYRSLGLAYFQLAMKEPDPEAANEYRVRSKSILEGALKQLPHDSEVLGSIAFLDSVRHPRSSIERALLALEQPDLAPRVRIRSIFALCDAYIRDQQPASAIPWLEKLVALRRQGGDWMRLAACRKELNDWQGALDAAQHAVEIMPEMPNSHEFLADAAQKLGREDLVTKHRELARQLRRLRENN